MVTFNGLIEDVFSEYTPGYHPVPVYHKSMVPGYVRRVLNHLDHDVKIRVFVESAVRCCGPCRDSHRLALEDRFVLPTSLLRTLSELIKKHNIKKCR